MASIQPGRAPAGRHRRRERQDHCINMRSFPAPQRAHLPHIARHVRHGEPWRGRVPHRRATSGGFWQTSHIGPVRRPASGSRRSNHAQPRRLPCLMRWVKRVGCRGRLVYHEFACGLCREDKGRHTDEGRAGRRSSVRRQPCLMRALRPRSRPATAACQAVSAAPHLMPSSSVRRQPRILSASLSSCGAGPWPGGTGPVVLPEHAAVAAPPPVRRGVRGTLRSR